MHFIVGPETLDSVTETGNCTYKPTSMAMDAPGAPFVSPNVLVNKAPLSFYSSMGHMPGTVTPIKKVLIDPRPCIPGVRTIIPTKNKTVFINGKLVAVQGDKISITTDAGPAPRQILGPYQHLNVMIESPMNDTTL
tara:strand:+ start:1133 stop:1540 length:408 start_codon:yes stop_codon:yes gene_type:complete